MRASGSSRSYGGRRCSRSGEYRPGRQKPPGSGVSKARFGGERSSGSGARNPRWTRGRKMTARRLSATCCIAGGGPAGIMLGFLLARAGIPVVVLEKHADFLRDFRGDTIHPSTLELMAELGLDDAFLKLPHEKLVRVSGQFGDRPLVFA